MSPLRVPLVAGLGARVGTSTLAAALHARDGGRCDGAADVVVCAADGESLRAVDAMVAWGPRPVLALALAAGAPGPPRTWLDAVQARFGAVVLIPHVARWRGLAPALDEAAAVLGQPTEHLPPPLRAYAAALRLLAAAVLRSGQLDRVVPPALTRTQHVAPQHVAPQHVEPQHVERWRGPAPVERWVPTRPVLVAAPISPRRPAAVRMVQEHLRVRPVPVLRAKADQPSPEPDDETLEAAVAAPTRRTG